MLKRCLASSAVVIVVATSFFACSGDDGASSSGSSGTPSLCGNEVVEGDEACDGADLGGQTCEDQGFGKGDLACLPSCVDFDRAGCGAPLTCGDGVKNGAELCDGADLGGETCVSQGRGDGTLACASNCGNFDTSACGALASCGDGKKNEAEVCDGADIGGATCEDLGEISGTLACAKDCLSFDTMGCLCKKECGGLECGLDPKCGEPCGDCDLYSACQVGSCVKVCDLAPIDQSGTQDFDVKMFTLSGAITLNGAAIPNDGDLDGLSRGQIELRNVDTAEVIPLDLKETGAVNYSVKIFAGTYDVLVHSNPKNFQSVLPDDQLALVMKGLVVDATMTQDIDVKMITASGKVTINGAAVPNDGDLDGLTRGDILLRDVNTNDELPISLGETGAVTYTQKMFVGDYDVLVHSNPKNFQSVLPDDQRALVEKKKPMVATMAYDFDVKMVDVTGKVTLNGAAVPNDGDLDGLTRGDVLLRDVETYEELPISLGETGAVTYTKKMFAGTYDVLVHSNPKNFQSVLPDDQRALVMKALPIQASGAHDFDLKMVTISGKISLNGGAMPNDGDMDGLTRGDVLLRDVETYEELPISLGETGAVSYSLKMFTGTYDVLVHSNPKNFQNVLPDDQRALVMKAEVIQASGTKDFDLKMAAVTGKITLNGGVMPNDGDLDSLTRGDLLLRDTETYEELPISLAETGAVTYSMNMFVGTFDVFVHSNPANFQSVLPDDQRAFVEKGRLIQASGAQDFDVKMVTISGDVTLNGAAMPNDGDLDGLSRGELLLRDAQTFEELPINFAETGGVSYSKKMFIGTFDVLVHSNPANFQSVLPDDHRALVLRGCLKQ